MNTTGSPRTGGAAALQHILFVCTGNTCRSPMAEAWLRNALREDGLGRTVTVGSAGISAARGNPMSVPASYALFEKGVVVSPARHRSRPVTRELVDRADAVIAMTRAHRDALVRAFPDARNKITTLMQWAGKDADVPDPFGSDVEVYLQCLETMIAGLEKVRAAIRSAASR